jgi:hypothetical protein
MTRKSSRTLPLMLLSAVAILNSFLGHRSVVSVIKKDHADSAYLPEIEKAASSCSNVLGNNGTWIRDWEFARDYGQYQELRIDPLTPFLQGTWARFRPSEEAPFPWQTSYRWVDDNPHGCQIDYTLATSCPKTCDLLHQLGVNRILFFGDSMSDAQYSSLINLLGSDCMENIGSDGSGLPVREARLRCSHASIPIFSSKEGGGNSFPNSSRSNMTLSNKTRDFIHNPISKKGRLLAVLNFGAHYHSVNDYQEDIDLLFYWMDELLSDPNNNDLVFFRPTPSEHVNCYPKNTKYFNFTRGIRFEPFSGYRDFVPSTKHDWHIFDRYNRHTAKRLQTTSFRLLLNVVNMTVL